MAVERQTSFLALLNVLRRGLQQTQETTPTVSMKLPPEQRRRHKRYRFKWVKALLERPGVPAVTCYLEDLSASGCCLAIEPAEDLDMKALEIELSRAKTVAIVFEQVEPGELRVLARLCHLDKGFLGSLVLGVQFLALSEAQQRQLETVLRLLTCQSPAEEAAALAAQAAPAAQAAQPAELAATATQVSSLKKRCLGKELSSVLVQMGVLTEPAARLHAAAASKRGQALDRYLLDKRVVTDFQLCQALALQSGVPIHWLEGVTISENLATVFSHLRLRHLKVVPFEQPNGSVGVASASLLPLETVRELEAKCEKPMVVYLAPQSRIEEALSALGSKRGERRRFARHKVALPVLFRYCASDGTPLSNDACAGTALDISEAGFKVEGPAPDLFPGGPDEVFRRGAMMQVVFSSRAASINALCYLRYILPRAQPLSGRLMWVFGLQVAQLAQTDSSALRQACASPDRLETPAKGKEP